MRRTWILSALLFLPCFAFAFAAPPGMALPDLFRKAKEQVKLGSFDSALATLDQIDASSQRPGLEKDREALKPSLAFYRGICLAALGKNDDAREQFATYLAANPNARLDPAMYPKKSIAVFEATQKSAGHPQTEEGNEKGGVAAAYRAFRRPDFDPHAETTDDWADGPARFLLSASEATEFRHLTDPIARSEFITKFWKVRDPKPETPENEFRDEFEKRVAFADQYFVQGETRGSYTDRGTVFVLLGAPAHSTMRPMKTGDDTGDPIAAYLYTPGSVMVASHSGGSGSQQAAAMDQVVGPGTSMNMPSQNWREEWRYFRKDLPGHLPYEWVDFDFISRPGYGEGVLQRDPAALDALDRAKAALPKP